MFFWDIFGYGFIFFFEILRNFFVVIFIGKWSIILYDYGFVFYGFEFVFIGFYEFVFYFENIEGEVK